MSEAARRVGCDRRVARMGLEELAAIGLVACPALDDDPDGEDAPGRWSAHPWRLAGPDQRLVRAVLQGHSWDEAWGACPGGREGEGVGRGGGVGGPHTSSQAPPANGADYPPPGLDPEELVCPGCGQLLRPATTGPGRCPDCAVPLIPPPKQPGGAA